MSAIPTDIRVSQGQVFLSEWTKLRSLRSTKIVLLIAIVLTIGFSALYSSLVVSQFSSMSPQDQAYFHGVNEGGLQAGIVGLLIAQLAIGVLGVLAISGEYSTGMIRSSFSAVPKRLPVLWAKIGVYGVVTLVLMIPTVLVSFFISQAILSSKDLSISISQAGVVRVLLGCALYMAVSGIFALGWGAILRNTAAGIAAFVGIMLVLPNLVLLLPSSWNQAISPYLPSNAGQQIAELVVDDPKMLSPWAGLGVYCAWTVVVVAIASVLLARRDA